MGLWHDLRSFDRERAIVDAAGASPVTGAELSERTRSSHTSHIRTTDSGYTYTAIGSPQGGGEAESGVLVDYDSEATTARLRALGYPTDPADFTEDDDPYAYQFAEWARCTVCGEAGKDGITHLGCGGTFLR